jgi:glycosyltransferase involved in cell wall biosynthesis
MSLPSVSIVMPVYNRRDLVPDALRSTQAQPGVDAEIIVVDDGSADDTVEVVREIARRDSRIRLIEAPHGGVAKARNIGVKAANRDWLTFLDSDDVFAPDRLRRQIDKLQARPDVTVVTGHNQQFKGLTSDFQPILTSNAERRTDPTLGAAMFRRSLFDQHGLFDETMEMGEDLDFYFRLFEADARILVEVETVYYYRRHRHNMTNDEPALYRGILQAYHKSVHRRKRAGRTQPLDVFFHRPFDRETLIGGA